MSENDHNSRQGLVATNSEFSLHAGVAMAGQERDKIEKLCRYIARPAIALERFHLNQRSEVVYELKKPYSDGTTHIVMTQLELLERLAAIVPRPRVHLTRFAGVFAPHYKYRAMVVPKPKAKLCESGKDEQPPKSRISWARLLKRESGWTLRPATCVGMR
ncbi:MAG: transposase [Bdellovibrionales bacterium]|nr:transposase [Bdellovibrionales bacterium]